MHRKNDTLCKSAMEDFFRQFLLFTFKDSDKVFDLNRPFEMLNKELADISRGYRTNHAQIVDMLTKVYYKGSDKFALFHIEIQGYRQKSFPRRMHNYFIRLFDKYKADICSFVIYTDANDNFSPNSFEYNFMGTSNVFKFGTLKVKNQDDDKLKQSNNPFAFVIRVMLLGLNLKNITTELAFEHKIILLKNILSTKLIKDQKIRLIGFLRAYIDFGDEKMNANFDTKVEEFTNKNKNDNMGILEICKIIETEKALKKGIQQGKKESTFLTAKRLHQLGVSQSIIYKSTGVTKKQIESMEEI